MKRNFFGRWESDFNLGKSLWQHDYNTVINPGQTFIVFIGENQDTVFPNCVYGTTSFGENYTLFFISNSFVSYVSPKLAKIQPNAKQHPEADSLLFENYLLATSTLSSKNNRTYSLKSKQKNKCVCIVFIRLWD